MNKSLLRVFSYVLCLTSCFLLIVFLWWHWRLGLTRYFDVDEFAHLSWAYQMLSGRKPYIDFLFFFPPGFHLFLMPLFALGGGVTPIIAGRLVQFAVFVLLAGTTVILFWLMRRSWVAVLAGVFLAFLPIPFDKFIEIRPDTLATLFAMLGMVFQIVALKGLTFYVEKVKPYQFLAGICYAVSLLILPKVLPQVVVAASVLLLMDLGKKFGVWRCDRNGKDNTFPFLIGLAAPLVLFGLWAMTLGNLDQVIYSLTKLPVEANKISQTFIMMPDLFFYPNGTFYGQHGWSMGLFVNHAMWIIAIIVGAYRLVTPYLSVIPAHAGVQSKTNISKDWIPAPRSESGTSFAGMTKITSQPWSEFLIAATFFTYVFFYVQIVPLKHTQYLIPIAVFVAFYAADAVDMVWRKVIGVNLLAAASFLTPYIIGLGLLWQVFVAVNTPKLAWTNANTIEQLTALYETIPTAEYILDLTGQTLYYNHPYVACCLPIGQSAPYLTRPLPSLAMSLEKTKTKYIFEGGLTRTNTLLPDDQAYITAHYLPYPTIGGLLVRRQ